MLRNYCCGCSSAIHRCSQCACVKQTLSCRSCKKKESEYKTYITGMNHETWRHLTRGNKSQTTVQRNPPAEKLKKPSGTWEVMATVSSGIWFLQWEWRYKKWCCRNIKRLFRTSGGWRLWHAHPKHVKSNMKQKFLGKRSRTMCYKWNTQLWNICIQKSWH